MRVQLTRKLVSRGGQALLAALLLCAAALILPLAAPSLFVLAQDADQVQQFFNANGAAGGSHTNNWAVLVCASKFWFNYRVSSDTRHIYFPSLMGLGLRSTWPTHLACTGQSNV